MLLNTAKYRVLSFAAILVASMFMAGCEKSEQVDSSNDKAYLKNNSVSYDNTGQFFNIQTQCNWALKIEFPEGNQGWCEASAYSGTGNQIITIKYSANKLDVDRIADLNVTIGKNKFTTRLTQYAKNSTKPSESNFLELPEIPTNDPNLTFVTHHITLNNQKTRNYSILYDTKNLYPVWVAYPLHTAYIGSSGRTDNWHYDPLISSFTQPNLAFGMGNGHDRGHMLPSASRLYSTEANSQTFYYTNMTPQLNSFNAAKWANTENKVRDWKGSGQDTLYVVTGAVLRTVGGNETVKLVNNKNDGKQLPVPNYYYKVVVKRTVKDGNVSYKGIGLWFNHAAASGNPTIADTKSIAWIEEKTGINFFSNLEQSIQNEVEASCKPVEWGITN